MEQSSKDQAVQNKIESGLVNLQEQSISASNEEEKALEAKDSKDIHPMSEQMAEEAQAKFMEKMNQKQFKVSKSTKYSFDIWTVQHLYSSQFRYHMCMISENSSIYIGSNDNEVSVFSRDFQHQKALLTLTGNPENRLRSCAEIGTQFFICSSGFYINRVHVFELPSYTFVQAKEFSSLVRHILWWRQSLALLSLENGELAIFDCQQCEVVSKLKLPCGSLIKAVKCEEEQGKLLVAGASGVALVRISEQNQMEMVDEKYSKGEEISDIFQYQPWEYLLSSGDDSPCLLSVLDLSSKDGKAVAHPLRSDKTCSMCPVRGLPSAAIVHTCRDLFFFDCRSHVATHIADWWCPWKVPSLVSEFDVKGQCLKVYAVEQEEKHKNVEELTIV